MPRSETTRSKAPGDILRMLCTNRQARHHYHIEETYEAGIALLGSEARAIRLDPVEERFV